MASGEPVTADRVAELTAERFNSSWWRRRWAERFEARAQRLLLEAVVHGEPQDGADG